MKKLEDHEYVKLCYFTSESCREASLHDHTVADGALALSSNTTNVAAFRPIGAYTVSAKAIPDNKLTWTKMTRAKTNLLACMTEAGWDVKYTTALVSFYVQLENHARLQQGDGGEQVILEYQCQV
ncbi:unnamed protein product [Cyclocybe aegerita]|uniref:Uncharacterized protein n=1 Tax=Cyclocybe aegerita TaxID=1973307 RepID=A0A8S0XSL9_CYCAE|nr:unnamed protein product [Cyclocybe aegerita]